MKDDLRYNDGLRRGRSRVTVLTDAGREYLDRLPAEERERIRALNRESREKEMTR